MSRGLGDVYKRQVLGLRAKLRLAEPKSIERTTGKAKRIIDLREQD